MTALIMARSQNLPSDWRERVLGEARAAIFSSVDTETNLAQVARLAIPTLADGCVIHLKDREGRMRLVTALHADADRQVPLQSLHRRQETTGSEPGPWNVLRSGEPELLRDAGTHYLARSRDPWERQLLERVDLGSSLSAPMVFHQRLVGAISLFTSRYGRRLTERDLSLVRDLAQSAAAAVAHSWLFRESERLSRVNDELLTVYAHNLRDPLGSMHIWLEILRSERLAPGGTRALSMIEVSIRHFADLVSQLVDSTRILTGRLELEKEATDLPELFAAVLREAEPAARQKRLRLQAEIDRSFDWLWADPRRLRQALGNLLSNSIKFTPPGGSVTARLERRESRARMEVHDTGIGISRDALSVVLEGFRAGGGSGLGLAIARRIAELHDGRIGAESEGEGRGSVFTIELPLDPLPPGLSSHRQSQ
jgi:signal transduction histidine kinase